MQEEVRDNCIAWMREHCRRDGVIYLDTWRIASRKRGVVPQFVRSLRREIDLTKGVLDIVPLPRKTA